MQMHPKLKVSSTIGLKKPKPSPFMQHFFENIEDFADEVMTTHEDPQAGDSKLEVKVSENQEPLNKVAVKYRWRGKCRLCGDAAGGMFVTDTLGTSSNFTKHISRIHPKEKNKWESDHEPNVKVDRGASQVAKNVKLTLPGQLSLAQAFSGCKKYDQNHPTQAKVTASIIKNLVIGCGLPHMIADNPNFRAFTMDVHSMWNPIGGKYIAKRRIPDIEAICVNKIKSMLTLVQYVPATLDIWSDRRMRSYLGITFHFNDKNY